MDVPRVEYEKLSVSCPVSRLRWSVSVLKSPVSDSGTDYRLTIYRITLLAMPIAPGGGAPVLRSRGDREIPDADSVKSDTIVSQSLSSRPETGTHDRRSGQERDHPTGRSGGSLAAPSQALTT